MASLVAIPGVEDTPSFRVRRVVKMLLEGTETRAVDLGAAIGLTKGQIYDRLRGDKRFTVDEVGAMAEYFGVSVEVFYAGPTALVRTGTAVTTLRKPEQQQQRAPHRIARPARPPLALVAAAA